ncbi:MAG TPA: glycosyltransferase family 2 protein [Woeseiaceae bacterium]|nr:glycosyltransferase family 2 protein [Woeseiaceae bacterium]
MMLSIVVPLYNEEESVEAMYAAIDAAVAELDYPYEILFVDDGSKDRTFALASQLAAVDPCLRVLRFRRNYGQTPAMAAGIDHAKGSVIVTMDGDLQNDPRDIAMLVERLDEGYDIAVGWRFNRQDKLITRKIPSRIANWIIGKITGVPIKDNGCSLKAYRADVIKRIPLYSDMHRFIPAMASIAGTRVSEVKVRHHARQFGESKYGLGRIYKVLVDLLAVKTIVAFSSRPMLWFTLLSIPFAVGSILCIAASIFTLARGGDMSLPIAGSGVLLGSLGVFLILNGALAELVYKTGDVRTGSLASLTMKSE